MSGRTYTEWRKRVEREARKELDERSISWEAMTKLSQRISDLAKSNNVDGLSGDTISKFYDPVTGFYLAFETMKEWQGTVHKIHSVCVDDDEHLFECPGEITAGRRWLWIHEDTMLLLFTILALYEGPYKKAIDLLYDAAHGRNPEKTSTDNKAKHLATYGIDIRYAISSDLRHAAAHMSFRPVKESGKVLIRFIGKDKTESDCLYTREKLVSVYTEMQDAIWLLYAGILHWWKMEYGPAQLFDDEFFRAKNGEEVRKAALAAMLEPENQTVEVWKSVVEYFRPMLETDTNYTGMKKFVMV